MNFDRAMDIEEHMRWAERNFPMLSAAEVGEVVAKMQQIKESVASGRTSIGQWEGEIKNLRQECCA